MTSLEAPHPGYGSGRGRPTDISSGSATTPSPSPPQALDQNSRGVSHGLRRTMCPFLNHSLWPGGWSACAQPGSHSPPGQWRAVGLRTCEGARQSTLSGPGPPHASSLRLHASTSTRVLPTHPGPWVFTSLQHEESHFPHSWVPGAHSGKPQKKA